MATPVVVTLGRRTVRGCIEVVVSVMSIRVSVSGRSIGNIPSVVGAVVGAVLPRSGLVSVVVVMGTGVSPVCSVMAVSLVGGASGSGNAVVVSGDLSSRVVPASAVVIVVVLLVSSNVYVKCVN